MHCAGTSDGGGEEKQKKQDEKQKTEDAKAKAKKVSDRLADAMKTVGAVVGLLGGSLALRDKIQALSKDARDLAAVRLLIAQSFELHAQGVGSVAFALRCDAMSKLQPLAQRTPPTDPNYVHILRQVAHLAYGAPRLHTLGSLLSYL